MRLPTLLTATGLLALAAVGQTQVPPPVPTQPIPNPPPTGFPPDPLTPAVPPAYPVPVVGERRDPMPVPPVKAAPHEETVEELMAELEQVKARKAELERQERELKEKLIKRLDKQSERLKKLGVEKKEEVKPEVRTEHLNTTAGEAPLPILPSVAPTPPIRK